MKTTIQAAIMAIVLLFVMALPANAEANSTKAAIMRMISKETRNKVVLRDIVRIVNAVFKETKKHDIDPSIILSLIKIESRFNPKARNRSGASGLTQVIPRWHRDKIKGRDIMNIETNIEVGTQIFADCLSQHNGQIKKASRCYSGGAHNYAAKLKTGQSQVLAAVNIYLFEHELPLDLDFESEEVIAFDSEEPDKFSTSLNAAISPIQEEELLVGNNL